MEQIPNISQETKDKIKRSSAYSLPNNPTGAGYKPQDIKNAFFKPIVDVQNSILAELEKLITELNKILPTRSNGDVDGDSQSSQSSQSKKQVLLYTVENEEDIETVKSEVLNTNLDYLSSGDFLIIRYDYAKDGEPFYKDYIYILRQESPMVLKMWHLLVVYDNGATNDSGTGADGKDGVGIESVTQNTTSTEDGGTNIITVTLTNGTKTTFQVLNGSKGSQGEAGSQGPQGEAGPQGPQGETGADGYTPQKGTDYFTEADKQELVEQVIEKLPIEQEVNESENPAVRNEFVEFSIAYDQIIAEAVEDAKSYTDSEFDAIESIAKGAARSVAYDSYEDFINEFLTLNDTEYKVGDHILIRTLEVPDLWIYKVLEAPYSYTYVDDETFIEELMASFVAVGYYVVAPLETQKVALEDYAKTSEVESLETKMQYLGNGLLETDQALTEHKLLYEEQVQSLAQDVVNLNDSKQDKLTIDLTPTSQSRNPVSSGGGSEVVTDIINSITALQEFTAQGSINVVELEDSIISLNAENNTLYTIKNGVTVQSLVFNTWGYATFSIQFTLAEDEYYVAFPLGAQFLGEEPAFAAGETWEISVSNNLVLASKVVAEEDGT